MKQFLVAFPIHLPPEHRLSLLEEYRVHCLFDWEQQEDGRFLLTPLRKNHEAKMEELLRHEAKSCRLSYVVA